VDLEFVEHAWNQPWNEGLPEAVGPTWAIGWVRPSQPLKSPTTLTDRALGAQTAKVTPVMPATTWDGLQLFVGPQMGPLSEQVQIKVA